MGNEVVEAARQRRAKRTKGTAITVHQRAALAAVLGGTNLGMVNPEKKHVDSIMSKPAMDLDAMVYHLWSGFMDEPGMEDGFLDECRRWFKSRGNLNSKKVTVEYVRRVWGDVADLVFGKENAR
jgi:hypothetical protein